MISTVVLLLCLLTVSSCQDIDAIIAQMSNGLQTTDTSMAQSSPAPSDGRDGSPCRRSDNTPGVCVPYHKCKSPDNGNANRFLRRGCLAYVYTCCLVDPNKPDNQMTTTPSIAPSTLRPFITTTSRPSTSRPSIATSTKPTVNKECGRTNPKGVSPNMPPTDDGLAKFGEVPWMCSIMSIQSQPNGKQKRTYIGGGSLIHPSIVLTAAHYVTLFDSISVRVGDWDAKSANEPYRHQDRVVAKKVVHQHYNNGSMFYDVALLFLAKPVDPAPHIGTVCLPPGTEQAEAETKCFATGWGKEQMQGGEYQVIMKKIFRDVVSNEDCEESLRQTRLGGLFMLHPAFMCAGGDGGADTCKGDGGSPLVCPIEDETDRYQQYGIVSWGIGCGNGVPGVYLDVSRVRDWIDNEVVRQNYQTDSYTY